MANILLITDYYPPRKSIATNRMKAFEKYLSEAGHKIFVITLGDKTDCVVENTTTVYYCTNDDWLKYLDTDMKESVISHYLKCAFNIIYGSVHLYSDSWVNNIIKTVRDIIIEWKIDVMITSYPTIAPMVAGRKIKELAPDIKWIMDMRDAVWTPNNNRLIRKRLISITKNVAASCDGLMAVSAPHIDEYKKIVGRIAHMALVTNGYDFDSPSIKVMGNSEVFQIAFTGNFYGALSPHNFFIALSKLVKERNITDIRFIVIGNHSILNIPNDITSFVIEKDYMEYSELISYCANIIDLLMLVIPKARERGIYTGKLFDYIGIGKPILGLVPKDDVAAELIMQAGNGYIAENENVDEIEEAIYKAYIDWKNHTVPEIDKSVQESCHRRVQVAKLDELIQRLC